MVATPETDRAKSATAPDAVAGPKSQPTTVPPSPSSSPTTESMPVPKPGILSALAGWVRGNPWMVVAWIAILFALWLITTDFFPWLAGVIPV